MNENRKKSSELLKGYISSDTFKKQENLIAERRKSIKTGDNVIHLQYLGVFENEELEDINQILKKAELELSSYNYIGITQNNIESFTLVTFLVINRPLIIELLKGLATNVAWDIIKETIFFARDKIKGKKISKVTSASVEEKDITFGLKVNLDENTSFSFELKGNLSNEVIEHSLDKVLDFLKDQKIKTTYQIPDFVKFSEKDNKWVKIDVMKEIKKKSKKEK